ncbi:MAG TPA: hypothetical protein IAA78_03015 [Candidatus Avamphibacillus intestinigallinarum]|nr:hypothetical protein [Candidatus Avamphibacillus intestinigallinarum]
MTTCLVLYHPTITSLTKIMMVRTMFQNERYRVEVVNQHTLYVYLVNVQLADVWQAVIEFESVQIWALYGLGDCESRALACAKRQLGERLATGEDVFQSYKKMR